MRLMFLKFKAHQCEFSVRERGLTDILSSSFCFRPSPGQLEQNALNRNPGIHPIILWKQEEEEKAKAAAASAPVDVKAVMSKIDRKK